MFHIKALVETHCLGMCVVAMKVMGVSTFGRMSRTIVPDYDGQRLFKNLPLRGPSSACWDSHTVHLAPHGKLVYRLPHESQWQSTSESSRFNEQCRTVRFGQFSKMNAGKSEEH